MRRRADGWLNATQILKVAGFDKPQRTRVLEREVQKGLHEKVQGGYGKYQGTWVPPESALQIARQYDVEAQLRPIIDYKASTNSPPPAPKHTVSSNSLIPPTVRAGRHRSPSGYSSARTRSARHRSASVDSRSEFAYSPDDASSEPSATPSPLASVVNISISTDSHEVEAAPTRSPKKRKRASPESELDFGDTMLEYFLSDNGTIPPILINPPADLDADVTIDEDGHSALHWAAAMGRIRVVKLLISAGADPFKVNNAGQTALMRAVQFANTYDTRKFAELYELLHRTTLNIDSFNRTVFHHIVDLAMTKGKVHAARYYMETALVRLADYPKELADIINFQDSDGETALTMAARCRSKRLVKVLLDHGADPNIKNKDQKSAEDYIIDDERFRSSPTIAARTLFRIGALDPKTQESAAARRAGDEIFSAMSQKFDELLVCFDNELKHRGHDIAQASAILAQLETEVQSTEKAIEELRTKSGQNLEARKALLRQMESDAKLRTSKRSRSGMIQWLQEEASREERLWKSDRGIYKENIASMPTSALQGLSPSKDVSDLAELYANLPQTEEIRSKMCGDLRAELEVSIQKTNAMIDQYAEGLANQRNEGKSNQYQRLVAAAWPGMSHSEIDSILGEVLKVRLIDSRGLHLLTHST
ncbi:hypothetical protein M408DRAFT_65368 [Serendipita vermifera MAFF 305830]|uniref:HTH APSES-type domain-containing protein n=1 Tax=Serendipita vermifera MAFF 305830 TaxID=933852 RepID=A0A0C2WY24_SERVB|nr:hypothetical protein M408DRAFT_65368 [Serendipita vermifera MAFF 305830]